MGKTSTLDREPRLASEQHKSSRHETLPFRQLFEQLRSSTPFTEAFITTTLPRGSLQIAQPQKVNEAILKAYSREFHAEDRLTWQAIARNHPLRAEDAWGKAYSHSRYLQAFMEPAGFRYAAAAPLAAPTMAGYPGAVHLYRTEGEGPFTDGNLRELARFAADLDRAIEETREARPALGPCNNVLKHDASVRQFVFDSHLRAQVGGDELNKLDPRLREVMIDQARQRLGHVNGKAVLADRVPLPDSKGDLWNFRVIVHREYPALGEGPFVFFCQQPECSQWNSLRPSDFHADSEIARLVPALKFMRENYAKGPTLVSIAKTVHLSPFHFHRRFTELLGITPKHFLLDCQIEDAKRMLIERKKDLADIATACGFAHQSHFTSRFKQATGLTPTRWRKLAVEAERASEN